MTQTSLQLPRALNQPLKQIAQVLDAHAGRETYQMGGGSVLAARWHHRFSTVIDLFFDEGQCPNMPLASIFREFRQLVEHGEVSELNIFPQRGLIGEIQATPFSFFATRQVTSARLSTETIGGVGIAAESSAEILCKKIRARMIRSPAYLIRDVYDLVVAFAEDRDAVDQSFRHLTTDERSILRFDAQGITLSTNPGIRDPAYPGLLNPADNLLAFARAAFTQVFNEQRVLQLKALRETAPPP